MSRDARDSAPLAFTGERFVPGTKGEIWIEHWHRYHFAARWAAGKRVLDVACGEGYGSALLARRAAHVTGADLSPEAIAHAGEAYSRVPNLEFACAPCTQLPLEDAAIDLAVTFETIEHIAEQAAFLDELARVLKPDGVLILSCPNKLEYSDKRAFKNEFHVKELYREELAKLVSGRFPQMDWYGQRPSFFSVIAPEISLPPGKGFAGELIETRESQAAESNDSLSNPLYFIVVASRLREPIQALAPALSVLADSDDWVHHDYEKVMRDLEAHVAHGGNLERQAVQRETSIATLQEELRESHRAKAAVDATLSMRETAIAARDAQLAAQSAELDARSREIDRRRGWRWWLKLPLIRLGLLKR
jgi:ubiquinone/menaquinone biosynthesis C-methylase UbiE